MKKETTERLNDSVPDSTVIKYISKEKNAMRVYIKSLKQKIGEQESYIQELEYELSRLKHLKNKSIEYLKEIKREELYGTYRKKVAEQKQEILKLRNIKDSLFTELLKHGIVIKSE